MRGETWAGLTIVVTACTPYGAQQFAAGWQAQQERQAAADEANAENHRWAAEQRAELERMRAQQQADMERARAETAEREAQQRQASARATDQAASSPRLLVFGGKDHKVYLGCFCDPNDQDSVFNKYGDHGMLSLHSIWDGLDPLS